MLGVSAFQVVANFNFQSIMIWENRWYKFFPLDFKEISFVNRNEIYLGEFHMYWCRICTKHLLVGVKGLPFLLSRLLKPFKFLVRKPFKFYLLMAQKLVDVMGRNWQYSQDTPKIYLSSFSFLCLPEPFQYAKPRLSSLCH